MNLNNWYVKQMPLKGLFGTGVGGNAASVPPDPEVTYSGSHAATTNGSYSILHITGSGALNVIGDHTMDFIMVAKGGSSNHWYYGGGGGGGGLIYGTGSPVSTGPYPVVFGNHAYTWNGYTANRGGGSGRPYGNRPASFGGPPTLGPVPNNSNESRSGIPGGSGGSRASNPNSHGGSIGTATQPTQPQPNAATSYNQHGNNGSNKSGGGAGSAGSYQTGGNGYAKTFDPTIPNDGGPWGAGANLPNWHGHSPTWNPSTTGGRAVPADPGLGGGGGLPGNPRTTSLGTPGSLSLKYLTP